MFFRIFRIFSNKDNSQEGEMIPSLFGDDDDETFWHLVVISYLGDEGDEGDENKFGTKYSSGSSGSSVTKIILRNGKGYLHYSVMMMMKW